MDDEKERIEKIKVTLQEWSDQDKKTFKELEARIGHNQAVVLSELANLANMAPIFPAAPVILGGILNHIGPLVGLDSKELIEQLALLMHGRFIKMPGPPPPHPSENVNFN